MLWNGVLTVLVPYMRKSLKYGGILGLFAGFNVISFVAIFLLVEETGGIRLEALGLVFRERKRDFMRFQVVYFLPWLGKFLIGKESLHTRPKRLIDQERGGVQIQIGQGAGASSTSLDSDGTRENPSDLGPAPMV
jgi:hypothetical protein